MSEASIDRCLEYIAELKKYRYFRMTAERYGMIFLCLEVALKEVKKLMEEVEKRSYNNAEVKTR